MKPKICILILGILSVFLSQVKADEVIVVKTGQGTSGCDETPVLDYNQDSQEFTVDFGEVDEISGGRVVIHDDSGGYQVKNFLVTPACHEFTFTCLPRVHLHLPLARNTAILPIKEMSNFNIQEALWL